MNKRRELKALLLAGVATLTLMSGCSKDSDTSEKTESKYSYYIEVNGDFVEVENVEYIAIGVYGTTSLHLTDGTEIVVSTADFYRFRNSSELQQELIKKLTK